MNKRHVIVISVLLAVCGVFLINRRHRAPLPIEDSGEIASQIKDNKADKADAFCAPGSTIYLTQEQQEYKLGKRGQDTPDVVDAKSHGAKAKVTLRVVDSRGNPVPDA